VIPALLLKEQTIDLSGTSPFDRPDPHYAATRVGGRLLPAFPMGTGLLAVPYTAAALALSGGRVDGALTARREKHAAALITVGAVLLFYLAARRFGWREGLGAAAVFALATPLPTSTGQALWTFTGEVFFLTLALFLVVPGEGARVRPALGGVAMGAAFLCRPTALFSALIIGLVLAASDRKGARRFAAGCATSCLAIALWQGALYGHPLGAYGITNIRTEMWGGSVATALAGTLVSPSRGVLVWFPYLLLVPLAFRQTGGVDANAALRRWWSGALAGAAIPLALASLYTKWWGGQGIGPRLAAEAAPFFALATIPLWRTARGAVRALLLAAFAFAAATQVLAACNPAAAAWNGVVQVDDHPRVLWSVRDSQLAATWAPGWEVSPAYERTIPRVQGREDLTLTGSVDAPAEGEIVRGPLRLRGWARTRDEDLAVELFLDGAPLPLAATRVPRPDVASAVPGLGDCSRAGWEVELDFDPARRGEHELQAVFRAGDGRIRRYPFRRFRWEPKR
jgi:hypothetical protein